MLLADAFGGVQSTAGEADWWRPFLEQLATIWEIQVFSVGGTPVTLGGVLSALLLGLLGMLMARLLTSGLRRRLHARGKTDLHAAHAIEKLLRYFLYALVAILALATLGIPLSAFAFLGGAFAIGLGFGGQTMVNNFLSGIILMLERPVRINDIIEVEGREGRVEEIRTRATRIRFADGIHITVPNSHLLERSVVNWTLSDNVVRTNVRVGVAYGSDPERIIGLLREALEATPNILPQPDPEYIFEDFGESALVFDVYFWAEFTRVMDVRRTRSELRRNIAAVFARNGVTIPFPQRDLHLHWESGKEPPGPGKPPV